MVKAAVAGGRLLAKMEKAGGGQPYQSHRATGSVPTLADLGFSRSRASRWQLAGALDDALVGAVPRPRARANGGLVKGRSCQGHKIRCSRYQQGKSFA
jgi:hypothetical protein